MSEILGERMENLEENVYLASMMQLPKPNERELAWIAATPIQEVSIQTNNGGTFWMSRDKYCLFFDTIGDEEDLVTKCKETFGLDVTDEDLLTKDQLWNRSVYQERVEPTYYHVEDTSLHLLDIPKPKSCFDHRDGTTKRIEPSVNDWEEDDDDEEKEITFAKPSKRPR